MLDGMDEPEPEVEVVDSVWLSGPLVVVTLLISVEMLVLLGRGMIIEDWMRADVGVELLLSRV